MHKGRGQNNLASHGTEGAGAQLAAFWQRTGLYDLLVWLWDSDTAISDLLLPV